MIGTGKILKLMAEGKMTGADSTLRSQHGAVCWRLNRGTVEVLLVTSRDTGRWVIPKGWPCGTLPPPQSAAKEAWEEAGVEGRVGDQSLGSYTYQKRRVPEPPLPCSVTVFPLYVVRLADKFPERKERKRKWFSAKKAARKVDEPELREILTEIYGNPDLLVSSAPNA